VNYFAILSGALATAGCVSAEPIVVDKQAYAAFTCPQLEQELIKLGHISAQATRDQDMGTGKQVAATILGGTIGVGSIANYSNMKTAEKNERKAKAQLDNIYSLWDQKKCSEWLYQRNRAAAKTPG
jgi:hypothetical protein